MNQDDRSAFLDAFSRSEQAAKCTMTAAMLVTPEGFKISAEAAEDNEYIDLSLKLDRQRAFQQHTEISSKISSIGVPVITFPGLEGYDDGIFPNNAFATIPGKLIIGHMYHPVRQKETKRTDVRNLFTRTFNYELQDLSDQPGICELTGSLAVDRKRNIGFCGKSHRADELGCKAMHNAFGLDYTLSFELNPHEYHTNLVLAILAGRLCLIYPKAFIDPDIPAVIKEAYGDQCHFITEDEKNHFVGNSIAITERDVLFSQTSVDAMTGATRDALLNAGFNIHGVTIDELEKGGGSLRCTIAEIF